MRAGDKSKVVQNKCVQFSLVKFAEVFCLIDFQQDWAHGIPNFLNYLQDHDSKGTIPNNKKIK